MTIFIIIIGIIILLDVLTFLVKATGNASNFMWYLCRPFWGILGNGVYQNISMFIGLISFVPYLQVVGFLPAALLALLKSAETGQNFWWLLLLVLIVYLVVQVLQDTIFTPRIMGKIMGLPPAIILLSLSVWGYALGIIGLILALPVTTLAISYYKRYVVGDSDILDDKLDPETIAVALVHECVEALGYGTLCACCLHLISELNHKAAQCLEFLRVGLVVDTIG